MILIKKQKIKIIIWNKLFKINKNYLKNFKIIFEIINKLKKKNILIMNPLSGSHHSIGLYKNNIKNVGWWENIIKKFKNFKIISISELNSSYGSSKYIFKNLLNKKFLNYKINYKNIIKIEKNFLKKINLKKIYIIIGGSIGGLKIFIYNIIYKNKIKFFLNIASSKILIKNKIKNKINYFNLKKINLNKNIFFNFIYLYNIKSVRLLNNLEYLSKNDIILKFKKIFNKNYNFENYKKNIFKYLNYKSNNFIKYFNLISYLKILKNFNKISLKSNFINKKNKNIFIFFKNDLKFNLKSLLKTIYFFLKKKKNIIIKIIKSISGHDIFLKKDFIYTNIISKIINFRSDKIWTYDHLIPNQVRLTTTPHSEN
ncbi:hypothetical protein NDNC_0700 [Candidatus Nasuia deltocephalinicola]|nr:hypothetical protein NDNC_0700 [Candidatus Nasuia deltocephalinicola]